MNMNQKKDYIRGTPDIESLKKDVLEWLRKNLPESLTYHRAEHTEDVLESAMRLARAEGVEGSDILILQAAAILHDSGFGVSSSDHESQSCELAKAWLPEYGFDRNQIKRVCLLIESTKIPQKPNCHLSEILCDADLDYLGRKDFSPIADRLYREFLHLGVVDNEIEWNQLQLRFFDSHSYFTETARKWRNERKNQHYKEIENALKGQLD